jgi:hypothetical protein
VLALSDPVHALRAQVRAWCRAGRLAHTVEEQRVALEGQLLGQMRTREELRLVRQQLEALLECGLVMYGTEGAFSTAAQIEESGFSHLDGNVLSLVGHTAEELVGDSDSWKRRVFEQDRRRLVSRAKGLISRPGGERHR